MEDVLQIIVLPPTGERSLLAAAKLAWNSRQPGQAGGVERDRPTWQPMTDGAEDIVIEALCDLARWPYRQLQSEYEDQTSDKAVDEIVAVNHWTFTADGKRFG